MTMPPTTSLPQAHALELAASAPRVWNPRKPRGQRLTPLFFLLPYLLVTGAFFLYPLIYATRLAFFQTAGPDIQVFVGLSNFRWVLSDPDFHQALWNTSLFAFFSIFLQLPLSLGLALLLNQGNSRLKGFFRLAIFAPNLVGQVFVGILFSMLFTPHYGLFNRILQALFGWGLEEQWLTDPRLVLPALIICSLWMYVGFNMIYFLAALQTVDRSLVEAATIDGAGAMGIFWNVTRPAIIPVGTFVVITSTIGSFQLFELPYILLQGYGPKNSGMTIVGYLYSYAFESGDLGTGAAVGWLLTFIVLIISIVQIRLSGTMRSER